MHYAFLIDQLYGLIDYVTESQKIGFEISNKYHTHQYTFQGGLAVCVYICTCIIPNKGSYYNYTMHESNIIQV